MNQHETVFCAVAAALLLLVTAWGNATAMLIVSALGLIAGLLVFRSRKIQGRLLLAATGLGAATALVIVAILKSHGP